MAEKKWVLKKIDVLSAAKISAVFGLIYGLVYGIFIGFIIASVPALAVLAASGASMAGLGLLVVVAMPVLMAITGFIGGAIVAFLYNVIAGYVGGIKLEFGEK